MERKIISVQIEEDLKEKIEARIKSEYPKLKGVSDVVRAALKQFLEVNGVLKVSPIIPKKEGRKARERVKA